MRDDPAFQHFLEHADVFHIQYRTPRHDERFKQMTLPEAFHIALRARGIARVENIFRAANEPNPHADLMDLADTLLAFDEFFRAWRIAHLTMVEKMIGGKSGTGFLGPEYLMETAGIRVQEKNRVFQEPQVRPRFFEELWRVRTRLGNS
ncbi:MAG: hypothetical protein HY070_06380 [Chloroflexi bacterium]|nr:hypothetical protein [Chloroflexota bacterium]